MGGLGTGSSADTELIRLSDPAMVMAGEIIGEGKTLASQIIMVLALVLGIFGALVRHRNGISVIKGLGITMDPLAIRDFLAGISICTIAMVGIFLVELLLGVISFQGATFDGVALAEGAKLLVPAALIEEFLFRSLLLVGLITVLRGHVWAAILISAAAFGIIHLGNEGANGITAFGNALGGLIYGIAFVGARNIWLPFGLHLAWNYVQGVVLGFPISGQSVASLVQQDYAGGVLLGGGDYGPEAGLIGMAFRFVIIALVFIYLKGRWTGQIEGLSPAETTSQ